MSLDAAGRPPTLCRCDHLGSTHLLRLDAFTKPSLGFSSLTADARVRPFPLLDVRHLRGALSAPAARHYLSSPATMRTSTLILSLALATLSLAAPSPAPEPVVEAANDAKRDVRDVDTGPQARSGRACEQGMGRRDLSGDGTLVEVFVGRVG